MSNNDFDPIVEGAALENTGPRGFLDVRDLRVHFPTDDGLVKSVDGISFQLERGRTLGIVGRVGLRQVGDLAVADGPAPHRRTRRARGAQISGEIWLDGQELVTASAEEVRRLRGQKMAMIFQDPLSAMHPFYTVGAQIVEAYRVHNKVSKDVARKRAIEMLDLVGIPQPNTRVDDYPHQFSGGMRQRAMIAMALVCNPALLIADEPTTALDVTVQAQILDLMRDLQREFNSALIIITHDLGVVAELADDIMVMYGGKAVEYGSAHDVFKAPEHPYTWGLLGSMPRLDRARAERLMPIQGNPPSLINVPSGCAFHPRCPYTAGPAAAARTEVPELADDRTRPPGALPPGPAAERQQIFTEEDPGDSCERTDDHCASRPRPPPAEPDALLSVSRPAKHFPIRRGLLRARSARSRRSTGSTSAVRAGETLGLVGESGCGKSTTGRLLTRLLEPTGGRIVFEGRDITHLRPGAAAAAAPGHPDGVPGPAVLAEPAPHGRHDRRRAVPDPGHQDPERRQARRAGPAGAGGSQSRSTTTATRTSSPAASASASASPARWRCGRS